jgi:hypothetical protein
MDKNHLLRIGGRFTQDFPNLEHRSLAGDSRRKEKGSERKSQ